MRRLSSLFVVATLTVAGAAAVATAAPASAATAKVAGSYVPVTAFNAVDTRSGAQHNRTGPLRHNRSFSATIGGLHGVPKATTAVAVTITAVSPTGSGSLTVYAAGTRRPGARNLVYRKGHNTAVTAIVRTSSRGRVTVYNAASSGSTQVTIAVSGYYLGGKVSGSSPGLLHATTPSRVLGSSAISAHKTRTVAVGGHGGVPSTRVGSVAVLLSVISPAKSGALVAYGAGGSRPAAATLYFAKGLSATQFAIVPTDDKGRIAVYNSAARAVRITADVLGYTVSGTPTIAGAYQPHAATRVLSQYRFPAHRAKAVSLAGRGGVARRNVRAAIVTITVSHTTRAGSVIAWRAGTKSPAAWNLQYQAGQAASDVAIVPVSTSGAIGVRNVSSGSARISIDIDGYLPADTITAPRTATSRYLNDLNEDVSGDNTKMYNHGCSDGATGSRFVLLDVGAQSVTGPDLSRSTPGVAVALARRSDDRKDTTVRLVYKQLVPLIEQYLKRFAQCADRRTATIAVGTNNSGAFSGANAYAAATRGQDWADKVIDVLAKAAPHTLTVVGADDIENGTGSNGDGFDTSVSNAQKWEAAYLHATPAGLIYNGSASGCPTGFRVTGRCADGWTQAQFFGLAHNGKRIQVLPQTYYASQAAQWANIDAVGGGGLIFAGSLTEHAVDSSTYSAAQGWSTLVRALAPIVTTPRVPVATDIITGGGSAPSASLARPAGVAYS